MDTRRRFLHHLGLGALGVGLSAGGLPLFARRARADDPSRVTFGDLTDLVDRLQAAPPSAALRLAVAELRAGTGLATLAQAAALANARAFGGEDYTGYHAFMAILPALRIGDSMSGDGRALPLLKVLYRSAARIHELGRGDADALHRVPVSADEGASVAAGARLIHAVRDADVDAGESAHAALFAAGGVDATLDALLDLVRDEMDVHRVVLAWRALETGGMTGGPAAGVLLRQCVRFCATREAGARTRDRNLRIRELLPRLMDQHRLRGAGDGARTLADDEVEALAAVVYDVDADRAADAVAAALAEGARADDVGRAISLAANRLLLDDPGLTGTPTAEKPLGSVHGASIGVHASDAANAWRHLAAAARGDDVPACLIAAAFHTAGQSRFGAPRFDHRAALDEVAADEPTSMPDALAEAIRGRDQARACAIVARCGERSHAVAPLLDVLRANAIAEDGALHAEKFFDTAVDDFHRLGDAFRWRSLVALARVAASQRTVAAPGLDEARELLARG